MGFIALDLFSTYVTSDSRNKSFVVHLVSALEKIIYLQRSKKQRTIADYKVGLSRPVLNVAFLSRRNAS